ncbi:hypothetical protein [Larkinella rosea]|uniref:Uncharacterized protein n=1 Tax=Larkinella rosea TaxID=2025312 RepID=A0A3P1BQ12_9BACT|nr:hypothetical protein [Larkinella rosea]RRB02704.1 hypothetical protein EHT25_19865 [Larkinella rosea]
MHRRNFPSILLYGFGLALALSLVFNGFLLYQQNHRRSLDDYELDNSANLLVQQQLSDCMRANLQKDSLIHQLEHPPNLPPGTAVSGQHPLSN